ncbi:MAG: aromatic ring-opening dioxygenase catalytic subunit (LigB family) [Cellvibrionaceae bacterium]|jgi:aromatic ring-opening dioxygenase catalytic subunit (LigB family)
MSLANEIVKQMLVGGMTPSIAAENPADPDYGFGHGFGIVIKQLLEAQKGRDRQIPLVPILLNTYFPPNQPTPAICWQVGQAIRRAVAELPDNLNVGVLASGGISHFVVNEEWDREMMDLMREGDEVKLMEIPIPMLQSGNSEILNWIALVSACQHLAAKWDVYTPIYSQGHREGVGFGFMEWR